MLAAAKYFIVFSVVLIIATIIVHHHFYSHLSVKTNHFTMSGAKDYVDTKVKNGKVVVFSKSYCPYCKRTKDTLKKAVKADCLEIIELDDGRPDMDAIMEYLKTITGAKTVPRVFIGGQSIGGNDDTQALVKSGKLKEKLTALDAAL